MNKIYFTFMLFFSSMSLSQTDFIDGSKINSDYIDYEFLGEDLLAMSSMNETEKKIENCSTIDYRQKYNLKMRNQKDIAWCFAHSSADNLQMSEGIESQISAADIAINYQKSSMARFSNFIFNLFSKEKNSPPEYGWAKIASKMTLETGYCLEENLPSEDWIKVTELNEQKIQVYDAIKDIYTLHEEIKNSKMNYSNATSLPFYYKFKRIDKEHFFEIVKNSKSKSDILENLRRAACDGQRVSFSKKIKPRMIFNIIGMMNSLDRALNLGKPVSIDFSYALLENVDNTGIVFSDLHTTPVFGRKYDYKSKQCMYLIKDSYSEKCSDSYDSRLQCENGYVWLPRKNLRQSATSIVIYNK